MYRSAKSSSMSQNPVTFSTSSRSSVPGSGNTDRRFSQPVLPASSSLYAARRGSEMVAPVRGGGSSSSSVGGGGSEVVPPSSSQYDDRGAVMEVKAGRKGRSKENPESASFDPDKYNPDGSLRTVHCMPRFEDAYKQARKARYIRHPKLQPDEIQLDVKQIFDKNS